jgi:hypothetical protein
MAKCGLAEWLLAIVKRSAACILQYSWWFDALCSDDVAKVTTALEDGDRSLLLDGVFTHDIPLDIERPASVAACHGAFSVFKILMQSNPDISFINNSGDNVIHDMIMLASRTQKDEAKYVEHYRKLCDILGLQTIKKLLLGGAYYHPLELACIQETLLFAKAIFETKGVYLVKEELAGMNLTRWFDCSNYESLDGVRPKRSDKNPIILFSRLTNKGVSRPFVKYFILRNPMKTWIIATKRSNFILLFLWFMVRLVHYVLFTTYDYYVSSVYQKILLTEMNITSIEECSSDLTQKLPDSKFDDVNLLVEVLMYAVLGQSLLVMLFDFW